GAFSLLGGAPGLGRLGAAAALAGDRTTALTLARGKDGWGLTVPVSTEADLTRVDDLTSKLAGLEVGKFVAASAPPAELEKKYSLGVPALQATLTFADKEKKPRTLLVGREGEGGFYAKLADAPEVFVIDRALHDLIDRDALAYRPAQLWQVSAGEEIVKFRIHKAGQEEYRLERKGDDWQVAGPFTVAAPREVVDRLIKTLSSPKAETYRAHQAVDLKPFGLDKPEVKVTLTTRSGKEHGLLVGSATTGGRFAK